ncbi:hypothetical protein [Micromonospora sp. WMMD1082]|uniref:hypothetical protein n=1 Tax=Micromonospora sp. WMMD1082 TaxID=3016104 RepID=UPI002415D6B7|nr:hypothetical protein [Micromonospora sp. WMMD1082]MDG4795110.1 hypothetical protein [Micromonospora sp. WMMD1082]
MAVKGHRVTVEHVEFLVARNGPVDHGATMLVDADDGIRIVDPNLVLRPGSGVRRVLLARGDLVDGAQAAGLTTSAFVRANAGRIAAELNTVLDETESAVAP